MSKRLGICAILTLLLLGTGAANADLTTIFDIQLGGGGLSEGDEVTVENVVVTATGRFGFFVQELEPDPLWGRMYSGIFVYANDLHLGIVHRGDLVNVTGAYQEYYDLSEIACYTDPTPPEYDYCSTVECHFEVVGTADVPEPILVRIVDVNDSGDYNEAYESVLIRVDTEDNTLYARNPDEHDDWYLSTEPTIGVGDSIVVDSFSPDPEGDFDYPLPNEGDELEFLQGILVYNYGSYKIAPRNCPEDMGMPCPPILRGLWAYDNTQVDVLFAVDVDETSAEDEGNYSFDSGLDVIAANRNDENHRLVHVTTGEQDPGYVDIGYVDGVLSEGDLVQMPDAEFTFAQGITPIYEIQYTDDLLEDESPFADIVVTTSGRVAHVMGNYYFLQEGDAGPFQHLYGRVAKSGELAEGDSVKFAGRVREYYGTTYVGWTPGVALYENLGPALAPVIVTDLLPSQLIYNARETDNAPEPWEDALVRICLPPVCTAAYVDSVEGDAALYDSWWLLYDSLTDALEDSCRTDLSDEVNEYGNDIFYQPAVGDSVIMTGLVRYAYDLYGVIPRRDADIVVVFGAGVDDIIPDLGRARLEQNRPNPFGLTTGISFRLEQDAAAVAVEIFDVTGACQRHLLRGAALRAGPHSITWDGRNDRGQSLASGTYFYRLTVDGRSQAKQMIRLD